MRKNVKQLNYFVPSNPAGMADNGDVAVAVGSGYVCYSFDAVIWTPADPDIVYGLESDVTFTGVVWSEKNSLFVASFQYGVITSPDGVNWTKRYFDLSAGLMNSPITVGYDDILVIGGNGFVLSSIDGVNWTKTFITAGVGDIKKMQYLRGYYFAVNSSYYVFVSNGNNMSSTWNRCQVGSSTVIQANISGNSFIAYSIYGGDYVLTSRSGGTVYRLASSPGNYTSWVAITNGLSNYCTSVIYHEGAKKYFIVGAGGELFKSTSYYGNSWTQITAPASGSFVACVVLPDGTVVVGGGMVPIVSTDDLATFVAKSMEGEAVSNLTYSFYVLGRIILAGTADSVHSDGSLDSWVLRQGIEGVNAAPATDGDVTVIASSYGVVRTSSDRETWAVSRPTTSNFLDLKYLNGKFVSACNQNILSSPDGDNWTSVQLPSGDYIQSVTYGAGLYIAVGTGASSVARIKYTEDPSGTWVNATVSGNNGTLRDIIWTGEKFIAVGDSGIYKESDDGITWTAKDFDLYIGSILAVTINPSGVIVLGVRGTTGGLLMLTSDDGGSTWMPCPIYLPVAATKGINNIVFNNGYFVAISPYGYALVSREGYKWEIVSLGFYSTGRLLSIEDGKFLTTGNCGAVLELDLQFENVFVKQGTDLFTLTKGAELEPIFVTNVINPTESDYVNLGIEDMKAVFIPITSSLLSLGEAEINGTGKSYKKSIKASQHGVIKSMGGA